MSTMYIAYNGTVPAGYFLGDVLVSIKVAWLMVQNEPHDRILLSMTRNDPLNFLWDRFIEENEVTVLWDDWPAANQRSCYAQFDERRRVRKVHGTPFHTYKELYRREDGGNRQGQLCGREKGLGRLNIFEYFFFGQESSPGFCRGSDKFCDDLIYYRTARAMPPPLRVLVSPLAKCQGNRTFTWSFWRRVIELLLVAEVQVTLNDRSDFMSDVHDPRLTRTYEPLDRLIDQVAAHHAVACGNTGIGWVAAATNTPLFGMEPPDSWYPDYRYRICGVASLAALFAEPDPILVARTIQEFLAMNTSQKTPSPFPVMLTDWEPWLNCHLPTSGRHALDIGGNMGIWARALAQHFDKVSTVEPNPALADHIEAIALPNVEVLRLAAWSNDCELDFNIYENHGYSAVACRDVHPGNPLKEQLRVPARAMDSLDLPPTDFVKIDVEGAEVQVLTGCTRLIERDWPKLVVECHTEENAAWIATWLQRIGYNMTVVRGPGYEPSGPGWACHVWMVFKRWR